MKLEDSIIKKARSLAVFKRRLDTFSLQFTSELNRYASLHTQEEFDEWLLVISSLLKSFHFNLRDVIKDVDSK